MAGYDGHRGWIYAVAVTPDRQKKALLEAKGAEVIDE
jgi:hypothetical protein